MRHGALLLALSRLVLTFVGVDFKMTNPLSEKKKGLSYLTNFINIHGHEAVGRQVPEETTGLERMANRGEEEWRTDVLMFRQFHRIPLDHEGAYAFTRFYWAVMVDQENGFRHCRQKRVLGKMLAKVLIPFIYRNRVWCLDGTQWPISLQEFEGLDEHLANKFPRIFSSHQWQTIVNYYEDIKRELQSLED